MKLIIILLSLNLVSMKTIPLESNATYWDRRSTLMNEDLSEMLGHDLILNPDEVIANTILMGYKDREFSVGFETLDFPPSVSFIKSRDKIDQSDVFKFIKKMPKGAILHSHDMAIASAEWVVSNLTYWDNLYMCNFTESLVMFRFFITPDAMCDWKLVSDVRATYANPQDFDDYLFSLFSLYTKYPDIRYPNINSVWSTFQNIFGSLSGILSYRYAWEAYLSEALLEFMNDNVTYMEFRGVLDSLYDLDGKIYTPEETVGIYRDVVNNFTSQNPKFFGARFIYAPSRLVDPEVVQGYVDLVITLRQLYPDFVAGFDLVGQEDKGHPLKDFVDILLTLSEQDPIIPVFYHAGETDWEGMSTDENIFDALLLNTTRIGHGYAISKHPSLLKKATAMDVPVEICPISNQVLMLVQDLRNHPGTALAASSFPLVISSDDPSLWGALPLSHDMYEAFVGIGGAKADLKFLKKLAMNSIKYSSLDVLKKAELEVLWLSQWNEFIASVIVSNETNLEPDANEDCCHDNLIIPSNNINDNLL